jgi:hypothetical protein
MRYIDREEIARSLTYDVCIPLVRDAMIAFSAGETKQLLRSIIPLAAGHLFGIMPGALGATKPFGAKLLSIFQENAAHGRQSHQGLILLFEPETGTPVCVVHAGEVTAIRTAAASAVATDALARTPRASPSSARANRPPRTREPSAKSAISSPSPSGAARQSTPTPSQKRCASNSAFPSPLPPPCSMRSQTPTSSAP